MSATDLTDGELLDKKIDALSGHVTEDHLEELREKCAKLASEADDEPGSTGTDVEVVEALSGHDTETLSDPEAINTVVERLEMKLEALVELGHDDLAADLRDHTSVQGQKRHAFDLVDEVDAEINPSSSEFTAPDDADVGEGAPDSGERAY